MVVVLPSVCDDFPVLSHIVTDRPRRRTAAARGFASAFFPFFVTLSTRKVR
jgi:hypothetical protein